MNVVLPKALYLNDGNSNEWENKKILVSPGRYEIERVANPFGYAGDWLVLKGTKIGMVESWWRSRENGEITIEGD